MMRKALGATFVASFIVALAAVLGGTYGGCANELDLQMCDDPVDHTNAAGDVDMCCCDDTCTVTNRSSWACVGHCPVEHPSCALNPKEDAGADGPISLSFSGCFGSCVVPRPPPGWSDPALVWIGPSEAEAPSCPPGAPLVAFEGHDMPTGPPAVCGTCSCGPLTGTCHLPATITASSATCAADGPSATHTPFDPPAPWDGSCTANDAIPAGAGVASVSIAPLTLDEGCTPVSSAPPHVAPVTWTTFARACATTTPKACESGQGVSACQAYGGFQSCISQPGNVACPAGSAFSVPHVFYGGTLDTRGCAPCTCQPPWGSKCTGTISIFPNGSCQAPPVLADLFISSTTGPLCVGLVPGILLGSKSATPPAYAPGGTACTPVGGVPVGDALGTMPVTFCCAAPPDASPIHW